MLREYSESSKLSTNFKKYEDDYLVIENPPFIIQNGHHEKSLFKTDEDIEIGIIKQYKKVLPHGYRFGFDLYSEEGNVVFRSFHDDFKALSFGKDKILLKIIIPRNLLKEGTYHLEFISGIHNIKWLIKDSISISIKVVNSYGLNSEYNDFRPGDIIPFVKYSLNDL